MRSCAICEGKAQFRDLQTGQYVCRGHARLEPVCEALVLVALHILPDHQGRGGGWAHLDAVRDEAEERGLGRIPVVASNDDLPALGLHQRYGFRIEEVIPGRTDQDHGGEFPGFVGIAVRDEIRLECQPAL